MKIHFDFETKHYDDAHVKVVAAYSKNDKIQQSFSDKNLLKEFNQVKASKKFKAKPSEIMTFTTSDGSTVVLIGMGSKTKAKAEEIRKAAAVSYKQIAGEKYDSVAFDVASFNAINNLLETTVLINETLKMTGYQFNKYQKALR